MSKIASYLQEHISGLVSSNPRVLDGMSRDGSFLECLPELVIFPRHTNDIRKVARFSWQLAERGHTLSITARGGGNDPTGAAIGKGIILSFPMYMNNVFEYEPKHKLVRVQPGMTVQALGSALALHGTRIPPLHGSSPRDTLGGVVANNRRGLLSGKYGPMSAWVEQLEIVLANGEVIQTGRINKRDLNRKKGLQTLEGELYRSLDNLIEDNRDVAASLYARADSTNAGYASLGLVKRKDGSFDLTPLFVGSQGTLGTISEMILRTEFFKPSQSATIAFFADANDARARIPRLADLGPSSLEYFDGELLRIARQEGKRPIFIQDTEFNIEAALLIGFDDASGRHRRNNVRDAEKIVKGLEVSVMSGDMERAQELLTFRDILISSVIPGERDVSAPPLLNSIHVPYEQFDVFKAGIAGLERKYRMKLPIYGDELSLLYSLWPPFNFSKTTDKQKALTLLDDVFALVEKTGGELVGSGGEGRLKSRFTRKSFGDEAADLFDAVKAIFDPYGIMNPGVKQANNIKQLVALVRNDYTPPSLPDHVPYA